MIPQPKKVFRIFSSKAFTTVLLAFVALIGFALVRDYQKQKDITTETASLEQEIEGLEAQKIELSRLVDVLESTNYIEQEARLRLGLKKDGEKVISVPENARPKVLGASVVENLEDRPSNPRQWFNYFFSKQGAESSN